MSNEEIIATLEEMEMLTPDAVDMTPILGTPEERIDFLMKVSARFFRERNEARAVARLLFAQVPNPSPQYRKAYAWLDNSEAAG